MPTSVSRFRVTGMDCAGCAAKIDTAVRRIPGVQDVAVSVQAGALRIEHGDALDRSQVLRHVRNLGYGVEPAADAPVPGRRQDDPSALAMRGHSRDDHAGDNAPGRHHAHEAHEGPWWSSRKARLTAACGLALVAAYLAGMVHPPFARIAFLVALVIGLAPIAWRAVTAARYGTPFSIEMLMTIAALGAVVIGAEEEAAAVVLLFLIGEMLEGVAAGRARRSIQSLAALAPRTALLERAGETREVAAESLVVGDGIMVRPGERIPADGVITEGEGEIDEAPVTGESVPRRRTKEDRVFAGTINLTAVLRIRVTAAAQDNTIARIVRLVEDAQESKSPTERFIDRFSKIYTPAVLALGALVAVAPPLLVGAAWSEWIYKGLAILLIGCPCALVISTPAAIAAGLSAGARRGLLMKGGAVLERLGSLDVITFDKTGTLTAGKPVITDLIAAARSERQLLSLAAALEKGSTHPLALAVLARAAADGVPVPPAFDAAAVAGQGVEGGIGGERVFFGSPRAAAQRASLTPELERLVAGLHAQGKTVSVLVAGSEVAGIIGLRDELRADAAAGLARLHKAGVRTLMLTGDNARTAAALAAELGIEARAELMPEDKLRIVRELQAAGHTVGKVGDGINDAPALAAADVGIAMGGGTDVALETADAAVLHGRVGDIPDLMALSRAVMRNIHQNIGLALGLKAVFLVTTLLGITGLWPAILADTGATVLVTANAMRLLAWKTQ